MPRQKKVDRCKKKTEAIPDLQQDHEQFLTAFEKPTQIYRFLRARQIIAPTFLHRTLLYMQERNSRTNARRKKFSVKDLLSIVQASESPMTQADERKSEDLRVAIASVLLDPTTKDEFFQQNGKQTRRIDVEVVLVRSILNKRKDLDSAAKEISFGAIEVPVSSKTGLDGLAYIDNDNHCITIPATDLKKFDSSGNVMKSIMLKFRIRKPSTESDDSESAGSAGSEEDSENEQDENPGKKRKTEEGDENEEDDPAGISLKNLQTGPRKRRSRYGSSKNRTSKSADDERNTRSKETKSEQGKVENGMVQNSYARTKPPIIKLKSNLNGEIISEIELTLFNSEHECQSETGNYELIVNRKGSEKIGYKRKAVWESFNGGEEVKVYGSFSAPTLKFALKWIESSNLGPLADSPVDEERESLKMFGSSERCTRTSHQSVANGDQFEEKILHPIDLVEYRKSKLRSSKQNSSNITSSAIDSHSSNNRVFYQFMYNNNTQQQTESRDDFVCPWCQLSCMTLYGLMKHLKLCHPRFLFRYSQQTKGTVIIVTVNECYDGSYAGNPRTIFCQPGMAFSRRGPVQRIPVTDVLVYKPERNQPNPDCTLAEILDKEDIDALEPTQMSTGHRRLYFHSLTTLPIRPCEFNDDSEEEDTEPDWLYGHTKRMIDEFTDVNEGEKALMKLWNLHVMRSTCISDTQMEDECKKFIDKNIHHLVVHSLRKNLLLHFICLVDFGVFKTSVVLTLMKYFDQAREKFEMKYKASRLYEKSPRLSAANFPEPDLLPRIEKLKKLIASNSKK